MFVRQMFVCVCACLFVIVVACRNCNICLSSFARRDLFGGQNCYSRGMERGGLFSDDDACTTIEPKGLGMMERERIPVITGASCDGRNTNSYVCMYTIY